MPEAFVANLEDLGLDLRLSTREAARYTGYSSQHFRNLRVKGLGPPYHKIGPNRCFYWRSDLDRWMEDLEKGAADAAPPKGLRNQQNKKNPAPAPGPSTPNDRRRP